jgi:hypothetical protein
MPFPSFLRYQNVAVRTDQPVQTVIPESFPPLTSQLIDVRSITPVVGCGISNVSQHQQRLTGENCLSLTPAPSRIDAVWTSALDMIRRTTYLCVNVVLLAVYHLAYSHLCDLYAASEAWTAVRCEHRTAPRRISYVLQYSVDPSRMRSRPASRSAFSSACKHRHASKLLPDPSPELHLGPTPARQSPVAPQGQPGLTPALAAVLHPARRAVVPRADDPVLAHEHAPDLALHAVAALRREPRELHEVLVPARPQPRRVREVERAQRRAQLVHAGRVVEQVQARAVAEARQAEGRGEVEVVGGDERLQARRGPPAGQAPASVSGEDEERLRGKYRTSSSRAPSGPARARRR